MKKVIVFAVVSLLSGCVLAPLDPQVSVGVTARVNYPISVSAYFFDPMLRSYYFIDNGGRYYMPNNWHPRHGVPRGQYRGKKKGHKNWDHDD